MPVKDTRKKEHIIPKEKAVFWLDKNGFWHTGQGKFENRKIINHFHSCIRYDESGYYLQQEHRDYREKVYFFHEDAVLFVFHVLKKEDIILVLNTGKKVKLRSKKLFIHKDNLYMTLGDERIKFREDALIQISSELEDKDGSVYIRVKGRRYRIPERVEPF
jgi:hypothetical protein